MAARSKAYRQRKAAAASVRKPDLHASEEWLDGFSDAIDDYIKADGANNGDRLTLPDVMQGFVQVFAKGNRKGKAKDGPDTLKQLIQSAKRNVSARDAQAEQSFAATGGACL